MDAYIVLDLETTGLSPQQDRILEIGALKVEEDRITDRYQTLINPDLQIPYAVQRLTGITQAMAEQGEKTGKGNRRLSGFLRGSAASGP